MNRMKLTGLASAFLLAAATAVSAAPAHKAKDAMHGKTAKTETHKTTEHKTAMHKTMHKAAMHKTAIHKTASHKAAMHKKADPHKAVMHKAAAHKKTMHKKAAMHHAAKHKQAMLGSREVFALNALEAAGYRHFKDMRASGSDIAVTTNKTGKSETLLITPAGKVLPKA